MGPSLLAQLGGRAVWRWPSETTSSVPRSRNRTSCGLDRHDLGAIDHSPCVYGLPLTIAIRRVGEIRTPVSAKRGAGVRPSRRRPAAATLPNGRIGSRTGVSSARTGADGEQQRGQRDSRL